MASKRDALRTLFKRNEVRKRFGVMGGSLPWTTFVGNPLQFTAPKAHTLRSAVVEFEPKQDLHGYDNPWPAGGGKNKLTIDTVVHEASTAEIVLWEGSLTGTYTLSAVATDITTELPNAGMLKYIVDGSQSISVSKNNPKTTITGTITKVSAVAATSYSKWQGTCKFQMEEGSSVTSWTPYSNICPISGWDSVSVWNEPDYDPTAQPMTTLTFPSTVYGGTATVAEDGTATGTDGWENIASYNGETITEPWLSSMDKYVSGATPTTGAQVVYKKSTPTTFTPTVSATPTAVQGINTMWTDGSNLTVEARGEAVQLNALQSLNLLMGGRYVNNHTEDDVSDEEALDILLGGNTK